MWILLTGLAHATCVPPAPEFVPPDGASDVPRDAVIRIRFDPGGCEARALRVVVDDRYEVNDVPVGGWLDVDPGDFELGIHRVVVDQPDGVWRAEATFEVVDAWAAPPVEPIVTVESSTVEKLSGKEWLHRVVGEASVEDAEPYAFVQVGHLYVGGPVLERIPAEEARFRVDDVVVSREAWRNTCIQATYLSASNESLTTRLCEPVTEQGGCSTSRGIPTLSGVFLSLLWLRRRVSRS